MQLLMTYGCLSFKFAANPNTPHAHTGIATKFTNPAKATLSASEASTLSNGKKGCTETNPRGNGGRGVAIFDVNATPNEVWKVITHLKNTLHTLMNSQRWKHMQLRGTTSMLTSQFLHGDLKSSITSSTTIN